MGKDILYSEVKIFSYKTGKEINLMEVFKPYDKQFYLFSQRALTNEKSAENSLTLINYLYKQKSNNSDSLYFSVKLKSVDMP